MKLKKNSINAQKPLRLLRAKLPGQVRTDGAVLERASTDNLRLSVIPDAVIEVQRESDVGTVLKLANQYEIPVTCRGAGSSATGSAVPVHKGWVLDLSKLKAIQLNPVSKIVSVGPGVVTDVLQKKWLKKGYFILRIHLLKNIRLLEEILPVMRAACAVSNMGLRGIMCSVWKVI